MTFGLGVLATLALIAVFFTTLVVFLQRGRERAHLSLDALLQAYLYMGSLAGVILFATGLASILSFVLAVTTGVWIVRDDPSAFQIAASLPAREYTFLTHVDTLIRAQAVDDLVRGLTFAVFGASFWAAHWAGRRAAAERDSAGPLYRGHLILGAAIFGLGTVALLPSGIYQSISWLVGGASTGMPRRVAEALPAGLATFAIWIAYLLLVVRPQRRGA